MKILHCEQRSLEWYSARAGVVTASEIDSLVSPTWKVRESKGVETYLARKIAERWVGGCFPTFQSDAMAYGAEMEDRAFDYFQNLGLAEVERVGFITDDSERIGCSPDGFGEDCGLEIKCPTPEVHVGYLLADEVPTVYAAQIQFSLYITGKPQWCFLSYRPNYPKLIKRVFPDPNAFEAFDAVIPSFVERLNQGYLRMVELNGGTEPDKNVFREEVMQGMELTGAIEL